MKKRQHFVRKLKHKRYTQMRINGDTGKKEAYNSDTDSWVTYAAIAYLLSDSDRSMAQSTHEEFHGGGGGEFSGAGASGSFDTSDSSSSSSDSSSSDSSSSDSGGSDGGGGGGGD
jgi:hypothetical protein